MHKQSRIIAVGNGDSSDDEQDIAGKFVEHGSVNDNESATWMAGAQFKPR